MIKKYEQIMELISDYIYSRTVVLLADESIKSDKQICRDNKIINKITEEIEDRFPMYVTYYNVSPDMMKKLIENNVRIAFNYIRNLIKEVI